MKHKENPSEFDGVSELSSEEFSFSSAALKQIEGLNAGEQRRLSMGIAEAYASVTNLLIRIAFQSFVHRDEVATLERIRSGKVVFNVNDYAVRVTICPKTYGWRVASIGLPGSLNKFTISRMNPKNY